MKRAPLEKLIQPCMAYDQQYKCIMELLSKEKIKPVKASGTNGKKPALYREYWVMEERRDYSTFEEELKFALHPAISVDYYLAHLERYEEDRSWVLMLDDYLKHMREHLTYEESVNERSFSLSV